MDTPIKVLLTGFEPFGGKTTNPSQEVVSLLAPQSFAEIELSTKILPVAYQPAIDQIRALTARYDYILMTGVAWSRKEICIERVAINLMDAARKDNNGFCPTDMPIRSDSPTAYFSNAPIKQMLAAIRDTRNPCKISNSAGTYVCNAVYYAALDEIANRHLPTKAVFIHLPSDECLSVSSMAEAIKAALNIRVRSTGDVGLSRVGKIVYHES